MAARVQDHRKSAVHPEHAPFCWHTGTIRLKVSVSSKAPRAGYEKTLRTKDVTPGGGGDPQPDLWELLSAVAPLTLPNRKAEFTTASLVSARQQVWDGSSWEGVIPKNTDCTHRPSDSLSWCWGNMAHSPCSGSDSRWTEVCAVLSIFKQILSFCPGNCKISCGCSLAEKTEEKYKQQKNLACALDRHSKNNL